MSKNNTLCLSNDSKQNDFSRPKFPIVKSLSTYSNQSQSENDTHHTINSLNNIISTKPKFNQVTKFNQITKSNQVTKSNFAMKNTVLDISKGVNKIKKNKRKVPKRNKIILAFTLTISTALTIIWFYKLIIFSINHIVYNFLWIPLTVISIFVLLFPVHIVVSGCANIFGPVDFFFTNNKYYSCIAEQSDEITIFKNNFSVISDNFNLDWKDISINQPDQLDQSDQLEKSNEDYKTNLNTLTTLTTLDYLNYLDRLENFDEIIDLEIGMTTKLTTNNLKYFNNLNKFDKINNKYKKYKNVTIQIPVYKEDFESVIKETLKSAMLCRYYYNVLSDNDIFVNIFVNDDGIQVISEEEAKIRIDYYNKCKIGYTARPKANRAGKFKKASNMNFGIDASRHYVKFLKTNTHDYSIELVKSYYESKQIKVYLGNDISIGDFILLLDSDTRIPIDCLHNVLKEFELYPKLGFTQHLTYPMIVTGTYWEKFIAHFTTLIYDLAIPISVAGGDISPLVGHCAVLRTSALFDLVSNIEINEKFGDCNHSDSSDDNISINNINNINTIDSIHSIDSIDSIDSFETDSTENQVNPANQAESNEYAKIWSENNVSEDFKLFMDLTAKGYYGRYVTYTSDVETKYFEKHNFMEGISLEFIDELIKFKKYSYGTCEILFNPIKSWLTKGPIGHPIINYCKSNIELTSKIGLLSYLFTYVAISIGLPLAYLNYFIFGWFYQYINTSVLPVHVTLQVTVLFAGLGTFANSIFKARILKEDAMNILWYNLKQIIFYFLFFGSLPYHIFYMMLMYFAGIENVSWGSTKKEVDYLTQKQALISTLYEFKYMYILFSTTILGIIIMTTPLVPDKWRIIRYNAITPLLMTSITHIAGPILLNPYIMTNSKLKNIIKSVDKNII